MCIPNQQQIINNKFIGRFVRKKQFQLNDNLDITNNCDNDEFSDSLSKSTYYTKTFFSMLDEQYRKFEKSAYYKILFGTTQPAHLLTTIVVTAIAFIIYPHNHLRNEPTKLLNFIYLASFCMYFGAQIWMTFVSGLSLYFSLPRHHFGRVQRVLFPKYFLLNSILSLVIFTIYTKTHTKSCEQIQTGVLLLSFLVNFFIRVYLAPPLLELMLLKNEMEEKVGLGMEVGMQNLGPLKHCPQYAKIHKKFRKMHMSIAIGNILTMGCTVFHLYHLSNKLCIL